MYQNAKQDDVKSYIWCKGEGEGGGEVIIGTAGKNSHWTRKGKLRQRNYQYLQPKIKTQS